jgi:hypothetical protein
MFFTAFCLKVTGDRTTIDLLMCCSYMRLHFRSEPNSITTLLNEIRAYKICCTTPSMGLRCLRFAYPLDTRISSKLY